MSSSFGKFVTGALIGGAIGAAIGMLLAPRSGVETREMIREEFDTRYREGADAVKAKTDAIKTKAGEIREDLGEKADALKEKARKVSNELEEVGRRTVSRFKGDGSRDTDVPTS